MSHTVEIRPMNEPVGRLTGVSLNQADSLFLPPSPDPFGWMRRPLNEEIVRLSLELSRMTYSLELEPWMRAGWEDFSIQVDNQLTTQMTSKEDESLSDRRLSLLGSLKLSKAKRALKERNPLARVTGALRQRETSDTIKAVVMIHPAADGRYTVAIGFMGTGSRFYDWFSNLRMSSEGGLHRGFYQLTQAFIRNEAEIVFPDTAAALGLTRLTLTDIILEMQHENSRFSLWMAGHSQGAAVMQVYCRYLMEDRNVRPEYLLGCGFASPTVADAPTVKHSAAYPLYHLLNNDDLVPRMGSLKHFGLCLRYVPDEVFRRRAYDWSFDAGDLHARRVAERLMLHIVDTPSMLTTFTAVVTLVCEEKSDDTILGLSDRLQSFAPIDMVVSFAGKKARGSLENMIAYMRRTYREIQGVDMDESELHYMIAEYRPIIRNTPLKRLMGAMYDRFYPPHSLFRTSTMNGAYLRIVTERYHELMPFRWEGEADALLHKRYARSYYPFSGEPLRLYAPRKRRGRLLFRRPRSLAKRR